MGSNKKFTPPARGVSRGGGGPKTYHSVGGFLKRKGNKARFASEHALSETPTRVSKSLLEICWKALEKRVTLIFFKYKAFSLVDLQKARRHSAFGLD